MGISLSRDASWFGALGNLAFLTASLQLIFIFVIMIKFIDNFEFVEEIKKPVIIQFQLVSMSIMLFKFIFKKYLGLLVSL